MNASNLTVQKINPLNQFVRVKELLQQLNPQKEDHQIVSRLEKMVNFPNYECFGLFDKEKIIGISSCWTTVRIYCGKQLELDNVVIDKSFQSNGLGKIFLDKIETWAKENKYDSINLNTYTSNSRSHKFYFNQGLSILGFHFQKLVK